MQVGRFSVSPRVVVMIPLLERQGIQQCKASRVLFLRSLYIQPTQKAYKRKRRDRSLWFPFSYLQRWVLHHHKTRHSMFNVIPREAQIHTSNKVQTFQCCRIKVNLIFQNYPFPKFLLQPSKQEKKEMVSGSVYPFKGASSLLFLSIYCILLYNTHVCLCCSFGSSV